MNNKQAFAEHLIEQETFSTELENRYRKELEAMLERDLRPVERISYPIAAVMGFSFLIIFSVVAWKSWGDLPVLATVGFLVGAMFGLAFCVHAIRILLNGHFNVKKDMGLFTGLVWAFMIIMMTLFLVMGQQMENTEKGTQMILVGLVFFVTFGVVGMLQYNIQQAELRTREAILRLEQHVAMLAERLAPRD